MKLFGKALIVSCAFISCALFSAVHAQAAPEDAVKIQVNDKLVDFPETKPVLDANSQLQVPFRPLMENLGYKVEWVQEGREVKVTMSKGDQNMTLKTGDDFVVVNGKQVKVNSMIGMAQGSVYVPLRFVSETLGSEVQWDNDNQIAIVDADGKYHAPAWYKPKQDDKLLKYAQAYMGIPYVWGGSSPAGFDCSGFVKFVFSNVRGIELPRTSNEMYDSTGVAVASPKPGDLVFFANGRLSHVGIYMGNGQFISATTSYGVHIDSLYSSYWGSRYIGAKSL
ncbi:NlpC/P60 family protein [Paenibacillus doosanensis]|uniref:D-gamma-glutamyl-meso-diaminopimelic acid endopeptidase CwlS n=1 Tax=Paenibacillus konkukensis TaxID=2020716 RepID=A0ABY4RGN5_9BACL|nr:MULTISPECIES: NlpC/P60 family protein [Paenibacillus]MCS7464120.1 NlpC/P60 family protein [Paenibacillus doosanensis]UQZ81323.1 D-gamma-glutamyl-meso-diaminopimelic acid endopeptidase CwlS precursor [Paenibacillus konkukensis]